MPRVPKNKLPEIHIDIDSHNENPDNSWILTRDRMQSVITALDTNKMSLGAAKNYYSAYGVDVPGRTKSQFIKNLSALVGRSKNPAPRKGASKPRRASQITGKAPSKRLVRRRQANNEPGYFPNPTAVEHVSGKAKYPYAVVQRDSAGNVTVAALTPGKIEASQIAGLLNKHAVKGVSFLVMKAA